MKKLLLGTILPVFAFASLVGAGYSTWYFDNQLSTTVSGDPTIDVTEYAQVGILKITQGQSGVTLTLDQSSENGITLSQDIKVTYTAPTSSDGTELTDDGVKVTATVTLTGNLKNHISLTNGFTDTEGNGVFTLNITNQMTQTSGNGEFTLDTSYFAYASEPNNLEDYKTMVKECQGKTINVAFTATIEK